ncbi:receptor-like protein kinase 4 [Zea mays]|uniref:non-specific serine/threonine protein kinase n=1 Tax=Zea mays TaxID=4577 RepID=A0A1D6M0N0_MAIZE|nr:receptor-like protein kinase 4 [Zea mays]AQK84851.1 receptor-like protein kinase 4 [Zea mays]AQK84855.1 receptor-like protein kinase 4 [Zea mays]
MLQISMNPLLTLLLLLITSLHAPPCSSASTTTAATATDTLAAGQALASGDRLVSRNGKFALGFFQPTTAVVAGGPRKLRWRTCLTTLCKIQFFHTMVIAHIYTILKLQIQFVP